MPVAHVQPACACARNVFEQELVEGEVFAHELEHLFCRLLSACVYVGGFALHVLACGRASHPGVEFGAAVAAGDAQHAESAAHGFEHVLAECLHVSDVFGLRRVVDAVAQGCARCCELAQGEVLAEADVLRLSGSR